MLTKNNWSLITLIVAVVVLAACGAQPQTVTVVETVEVEKEVRVVETVEVEVEKEVVVTATPEAVAAAVASDVEQTLVLASGRDLGPGNPHDYSSSFVLLDLLYEPLVRYGSDGAIEPALAESWEISEDGLTWTFNLRQDVMFHDGTSFNAEAVKWNMDRWVGVDSHNWLPTTSRIAEVETPDEFTVVLTLNQPYYPAMQDLTLVRPVRFLSTEAVDQAGEFTEAIGTGPWRVESLDDRQAILVRNEEYWGEKPALEKLVIEVILDPQTRIAALLSGEVDVIGGEYLGGISLESLPVLERNDAINILSGDGVISLYISTQYETPPFDDVQVRRALNMAIDRAGISTALFNGKAEPAQNLAPANIPYVTLTGTDVYEYAPEQAAALLAEAGWVPNADGILEKDGNLMQIDLVVDQSSRPETATMAEVIQAQFKEIGIELEIRAFDYSGWLDIFYAKDFDLLMRFSWGPPYDPHSLLAGAFSTSTNEESTLSYADPILDDLISSALASTDEAERQEIYNQIWQRLDDEAAVIPLVYPQRVYAIRSDVEGFRLGGTEYDSAYSVQEVIITGN